MNRASANRWILPLVALFVLGSVAAPALSASLGTKVLRGAAIGLAVKMAASPLDKFINTITFNHGMRDSMSTKVVPILSVGEKGYIGGAQVSGPAAYVKQVQAVLQYEKNLSTNNYRVKILLPSASINPVELKRVPKVGVSAIIDVALDGGLQGGTVGRGIGTGDVIRNAAVLVAIKNLGGEINKGINVLTFNKGLATKVVPMGSIGEKAYVGGAQVSASANSINKVNAVWQYEDLFSGGKFRVKVLVPTTSSNPLKMKRVSGAGVTAVFDMAVRQQEKAPEPWQRDRRPSLEDLWRSRSQNHASDAKAQAYPHPDIRVLEPKRHDNGLHKGWYKGKHLGWEKK